jgi:hypothetical protein
MPLMPDLLGTAFETLDAPLHAVHRGTGGEWSGTATVRRGRNPLARLACRIAGLPAPMQQAPITVRIDVTGARECWTRRFGTAGPMSSRLWQHGSLLFEQLGPVRTGVQLAVQKGELQWRGMTMSILGVPLPRWAFEVTARICAADAAYRFEVTVWLAAIGELIHYEGQLDVGK